MSFALLHLVAVKELFGNTLLNWMIPADLVSLTSKDLPTS
jgi:hypothetical protein